MVSAGGQDARVLKGDWNVEYGQELRSQRLKSCEGMRRDMGEGTTWLVSERKTAVDSIGPGLQNAVLVKSIPHPWLSFPVFCLPVDRKGGVQRPE